MARRTRNSGQKEQNTKKLPTPKGLKKLKQEVDKSLGEASNEIATALTDRAKTGDLRYVRFAIELAESGATSIGRRPESASARWAKQLEREKRAADSAKSLASTKEQEPKAEQEETGETVA